MCEDLWKLSIRRVDKMKGRPIVRGRRRPRKTIGEFIKKDLDVSSLSINYRYDLWHRLIYVGNLT